MLSTKKKSNSSNVIYIFLMQNLTFKYFEKNVSYYYMFAMSDAARVIKP